MRINSKHGEPVENKALLIDYRQLPATIVTNWISEPAQ
jgi:hypothetical protein